MERTDRVYQTYVEILKRELVSAMGCTEPIALAYCAAVARASDIYLCAYLYVCQSPLVLEFTKDSPEAILLLFSFLR